MSWHKCLISNILVLFGDHPKGLVRNAHRGVEPEASRHHLRRLLLKLQERGIES